MEVRVYWHILGALPWESHLSSKLHPPSLCLEQFCILRLSGMVEDRVFGKIDFLTIHSVRNPDFPLFRLEIFKCISPDRRSGS